MHACHFLQEFKMHGLPVVTFLPARSTPSSSCSDACLCCLLLLLASLAQMVVVGDDCALPPPRGIAGRRGLAGTVFVHKVAGAAAEEGKSLADVAAEARQVAGGDWISIHWGLVGTMGVGLSVCTVPGGFPSDRLPASKMELGLGIVSGGELAGVSVGADMGPGLPASGRPGGHHGGGSFWQCEWGGMGQGSVSGGRGWHRAGLGIHGEPGAAVVDMQPVDVVVSHMLKTINNPDTGYMPLKLGSRVALMVNRYGEQPGRNASYCSRQGCATAFPPPPHLSPTPTPSSPPSPPSPQPGLGATPAMEVMIAAGKAVAQLQVEHGLAVERVYAGHFMTSLDMSGLSLSVLKVDDQVLQRLDAPTQPAPLLLKVDDQVLQRLDAPTLAPAWPNACQGARPATKVPVPLPPAPPGSQPVRFPPSILAFCYEQSTEERRAVPGEAHLRGGAQAVLALAASACERPKELTEEGRCLERCIRGGAQAVLALAVDLNAMCASKGVDRGGAVLGAVHPKGRAGRAGSSGNLDLNAVEHLCSTPLCPTRACLHTSRSPQASACERPKELTEEGRCLERCIRGGAQAVLALAADLNAWDAKIGDGDCGSTAVLAVAADLNAWDAKIGDGNCGSTVRWEGIE
ncbi:unnamed protein product [Closterium sp. NIES-65]|nr:unnamed protein product [Closterium sp. NIES-65]